MASLGSDSTSHSYSSTFYGIPNIYFFTWTQGLFFSATAYGAISTLFIFNFNLLRSRAKQEKHKYGRLSAETTWIFLYTCWIFILCSGLVAVELEVSLPHQPAAPTKSNDAFEDILDGLPQSIVGVACFSLIHWAVNLLLIWRCYVIYRNSKTTVWLLLSFSGFIFLISFATGVLFLIKVIMKDAAILSLLLLIYGAACLTSNLIFTFMIVVRLYLYRRHIIKLVGRKYAGHYTSIASMFIESGTIMNVALVLVIVALALRSTLIALLLLIFPLIEALASYLIIFRVANGTAWSPGTASELIAQHAAVGGATTLLPEERLSAMRYRVTSQVTQTSTAFNFNHGMTSSNVLGSERYSQQSSVRFPERCRRGAIHDIEG